MGGRERRQVAELPPLRLVVTEHQALHLRCSACQQIRVGSFPAEAPSRAPYGPRVRALAVYLVSEPWLPVGRVQHLLAAAGGVDLARGTLARGTLARGTLARGTLVSWVQQAARVWEPVERQITDGLRRARVRRHDETGGRRAGRLAWAQVRCTDRRTP